METNPENAGQGVLDLLIMGAENLKLLTLGPVLAGLLAYGVSFQLPRTYESEAILDLSGSMPVVTPAQAAIMMKSPLVLDDVIATLQFTDAQGSNRAAAREGLNSRVRVVAGKDGFLRLTVKDASPARAQSLAAAVIDSWLKTTSPGEMRRAELESRLAYAKESLNAIRRLRDRVAAGEDRNTTGQTLRLGDAVAALEVASKLQTRHLNDVVEISGALNGVTREVIKQPPTLPMDPTSPRKGLVALMTALVAGFALLFVVYVRQVWRHAARNPHLAAKQAQLLAALRLKR